MEADIFDFLQFRYKILFALSVGIIIRFLLTMRPKHHFLNTLR